MRLAFSEEAQRGFLQRAEAADSSKPYVTLATKDWQLSVYTPNRVCVWRVLTYLTKEPETIAWIDTMPRDAVLYDVGSNIGLYALWAAAVRGLRVIAFAPEAGSFQVLNENLRVNRLTERCTAFCLGISDKVGFGTMQVRETTAGSSGHQVQVTDGRRVVIDQPAASQGIATATLDHLVYECGFPCPTHIKVDVDGLEHAVIKGSARLLGDERLRSIMIELMVKKDFHQSVITTLEAAGFEKDAAMEQSVHAKTQGVAHTGNILFTRR